MTADEVNKYINEVAFSGAEEFLEQYKDSVKDSGIIGHFGLGFYSAFMVAKKLKSLTSPTRMSQLRIGLVMDHQKFSLEKHNKTDRGTEIILHIDKDSKDFWKSRIFGLC